MFYPILAVIFMWIIAVSGRDFGPMVGAQRRALSGRLGGEEESESEEGLSEKEGIPNRALNAILPILTLLAVTIAGLFVTGSGATVMDIIGSADSFSALLWGSFLSVIVAGALSLGQRLLDLAETVDAFLAGIKAVLQVLVILTLAWALSAVTDQLHAANYLATLLGEAIPPALMPALVFVLAAAISFATGTSWGTMGILMPLAIPLTWAILGQNDMAGPQGMPVLYAAVAAVLGGAVWGDHTSPISDTSVLSAATSQCDLIDHIKTQLPYGLLVGIVAVILGLLPTGYGLPWWIAMIVCIAALAGAVYIVGAPIVGEDKTAGAGKRDREPGGAQHA